MIHCLLEGITTQRKDQLLQWLSTKDAALVRECVMSEVAALECLAAEKLLERPEAVLLDKPPPIETREALVKAARYKIFLDVLEEISRPDFLFRKARLSLIHEQPITTTYAP